LPRSPEGRTHINGFEARALPEKEPLHVRDNEYLCQLISTDELYHMTDALKDVEAYATSMWGGDWSNVYVNPVDYPAYTAHACYSNAPQFTAIWSSTPKCSKSSVNVTGFVQHGSNSAQVTIFQGTSVTVATTVSVSTYIGSSSEFSGSIEIGIPGLADFEFSISHTSSFTVKNSRGSTDSTENDGRTQIQDTLFCAGPANVEVDVEFRACSAQGTVNLPVTLTGWVWFSYHKRKNGHYLWAVYIDSYSPLAHRQEYMTLSVNANTASYGNFYALCCDLV